ncbi:putative phosphoglycerate mutase [Arthrobacter stackebrandtii]|uniref:Phosphoglycerate mutase n=1 Tax=Arthrobacter stackebrandtii TaxID=272161 RepID=A0ABS4YVC1_9MICC|nr:histidine phosphatase family protein [Arthrobacter stackebrandtii]MBP2412716.1 putative phosphoglycerate mutase [Arthrobacter stackebrandtii]PYG99918.1 histidine phosphatase family protein [Arthrobacter stackebrandtii]
MSADNVGTTPAAAVPGGPKLWLLRHGETEWSRSGQYTGLTDIPLTEEGEGQARSARKALAGVELDLVLTSPLQRAHTTAILAGYPDAVVEPNAVEWDYGDYEGIDSAVVRAENPGYLIWDNGVPNGESLDSVAARADRIVERVRAVTREDGAQANVLLVAHGHFLRILTARWLGLPAGQGRHFMLGTAKVCTLGWDKKTPAVEQWGL